MAELYGWVIPKGQSKEKLLSLIVHSKEQKQFTTSSTYFGLPLNGSGTGFLPTTGHLCGFPRELEIEQIFSTNEPDYKGRTKNIETYDDKTRVWTIQIGDDAKCWAKVVGKLLAHPFPKAKKLVIDSSEIRGAGQRVQGYGWISVGDRPFQDALMNICKPLNKRAGIYLQV